MAVERSYRLCCGREVDLASTHFAPSGGATLARLDHSDPPGVARLVPRPIDVAALADRGATDAEPAEALPCVSRALTLNLGVAVMEFDDGWCRPRISHTERLDTALDRALAPECFADNEPLDSVARFISLAKRTRAEDTQAACAACRTMSLQPARSDPQARPIVSVAAWCDAATGEPIGAWHCHGLDLVASMGQAADALPRPV
ncbi:uncharacterized protein ACA1_022210 [Acanthamoeba castellanii str. Neff]|uniref:Uncharacterized protein n=1 Tax=Acanthamoeba castellanii (strain ATCC 30010 / Neff) TaxID=1257118 RepID=L8GPX3_ACACF|nr:uncharacterized protein ACA1_022210 [Acanthamoeba castellanii str. Neff]ELR14693.1 hypothetical protein ACA1_022210 [Acanthamoeba castellanii str. Neff]